MHSRKQPSNSTYNPSFKLTVRLRKKRFFSQLQVFCKKVVTDNFGVARFMQNATRDSHRVSTRNCTRGSANLGQNGTTTRENSNSIQVLVINWFHRLEQGGNTSVMLANVVVDVAIPGVRALPPRYWPCNTLKVRGGKHSCELQNHSWTRQTRTKPPEWLNLKFIQFVRGGSFGANCMNYWADPSGKCNSMEEDSRGLFDLAGRLIGLIALKWHLT